MEARSTIRRPVAHTCRSRRDHLRHYRALVPTLVQRARRHPTRFYFAALAILVALLAGLTLGALRWLFPADGYDAQARSRVLSEDPSTHLVIPTADVVGRATSVGDDSYRVASVEVRYRSHVGTTSSDTRTQLANELEALEWNRFVEPVPYADTIAFEKVLHGERARCYIGPPSPARQGDGISHAAADSDVSVTCEDVRR